MRSIVPSVVKSRASARRAHSTTCSPVAPGIVAGSPMPTSMASPRGSIYADAIATATIDQLPGWARAVLDEQRVARLAFTDDRDRPRVLPVTFAVVAGAVWSAV